MRMIFSTVFGPHEPAFTVGSLAISATARPPTEAIPVTTPSAPSPSCSQFASRASSTNESGSTSRATRSRTGSLPCCSDFSWCRRGPPSRARSSASARSVTCWTLPSSAELVPQPAAYQCAARARDAQSSDRPDRGADRGQSKRGERRRAEPEQPDRGARLGPDQHRHDLAPRPPPRIRSMHALGLLPSRRSSSAVGEIDQYILVASDDFAEGTRAFLEKRD